MRPLEADENGSTPEKIREIENLEDIVSQIGDRRFEAEFGDEAAPEAINLIRENPDRIDSREDFDEAARRVGILDPEPVLGFSTRPEHPAHIREGAVPVEIATKIHEDIHRATHPETRREMSTNAELQGLYEGLTEYFTQRAVEDLRDNAGAAYPEEMAEAEMLVDRVGEDELRGYLFRHELSEEIENTLRRLADRTGE